MKKTRLNIEFTYDFWVFGISSSVKFFKLAWAVNKYLGLQLIRESDHLIVSKDAKTAAFGLFRWDTETGSVELFKNKSLDAEGVYILPEFNHFDYLVKADCSLQSFSKEEILKELKDVECIEYIAALEVNDLKSKDNFLT
ncbi:MAG: IPExxxVDY family protein [Bacteroidota bacterium]